MEDNPKLSFENKINNNIFKFLIREYHSKKINPLKCLQILIKLIFSKLSNNVKIKYVNVSN
jgi:hypothetical protein